MASTRAASRLGNNQEDPAAPVSPPTREPSEAPTSEVKTPEASFALNRAVPNTPLSARKQLVSQKILEKHTDLVTLDALSNILSQLVHRTDTPTITAISIQIVVLLLPEAIALNNNLSPKVLDLSDKLSTLIDLTTRLSERPETTHTNPNLKAVEEKLGRLSEDVKKLQTSAGATESVALETQKSLIALGEGLWEQVPARKGTLGAPPNEQAGPSMTEGGPPSSSVTRARPPSARQDEATAKRLQSQGCFITIHPKSTPFLETLVSYNARALVQKAEQAWESTWKALMLTSDYAKVTRPRVTFRTATRLPHGDIRYELENRAQASFLSDARTAHEFEKAYGDVTCVGQGAHVLLQCAPVSWIPEDPESLRSLERENRLHAGDILAATWVKPIARREPTQRQAMVKLELRSQEIADRLITMGGQLECTRVVFRKLKQEPTRCLKCQIFGHKAVKCRSSTDVCSQCGGGHRSAVCDNRTVKKCISCKSETHSSYDRACPTFRKECERFDQRKPENRSRFFNTALDAAPAPPPFERPIFHPSTATLADAMPPFPLEGEGRRPKQKELHAYLRSNRRSGWTDAAPIRKQRERSATWDCERATSAPISGSTPPSPQTAHISPPAPAAHASHPSPTQSDNGRFTPSRPHPRSRRASISSVTSDATL